MNKTTSYHVRWMGKVSGPFDASEVRDMLASGRLSKHHQISSDGTRWRSVADSVFLASPKAAVPVATLRGPERSIPPISLGAGGVTTDGCVTPNLTGTTAFASRTEGEAASDRGVTPNEILMAQTRACLSGRWGTAVGAVLIVFLLGILANLPGNLMNSLVKGGSLDMATPALVFWSLCLGLLSFAVTQPLQFGGVLLALDIGRRAELVAASRVFDGFRRFAAVVVAELLTTLYVLLWALLLIIPGIVATYAYSMTLYILADRPDLRASDAIRLSKQCMDGYKSKLFGLHMRFFGWGLLSVLTLGIGFLWLVPYMSVATARFYDDLPKPGVAG